MNGIEPYIYKKNPNARFKCLYNFFFICENSSDWFLENSQEENDNGRQDDVKDDSHLRKLFG